MNRMPRLSESGIEYLDYAWNFYSGCENHERGICPVPNCWAKGITERFPNNYPNGFDSTYYPSAFESPLHLKKPSIIGVAFMGDLFGDWVDPNAYIGEGIAAYCDKETLLLHAPIKELIFSTIERCPQHTFLTLTKCPWNLPKWSPFPDNCWPGVTATDAKSFLAAGRSLEQIRAKIKYVSLEPLLGYIGGLWLEDWLKAGSINWVIIGAQTKPYKPPEISWVEEIMRACDKAGVPVFLKNNLNPLFLKEFPPKPSENFGCWNLPDWAIDKEAEGKGLLKLRQEMPG